MAHDAPDRDHLHPTRSASPGSAIPDPSGPGQVQDPSGTPRWVKIFGVVAVVVVVLVVVVLLAGHSPSRHG
jgi:hypothetical protein